MSNLPHDSMPAGSPIGHREALMLAEVLTRQSELNDSVARALQAVALTADMHDASFAELRDEICALGNRLEGISKLVLRHLADEALGPRLHSVKVPE